MPIYEHKCFQFIGNSQKKLLKKSNLGHQERDCLNVQSLFAFPFYLFPLDLFSEVVFDSELY